jgi:hypothetical protein
MFKLRRYITQADLEVDDTRQRAAAAGAANRAAAAAAAAAEAGAAGGPDIKPNLAGAAAGAAAGGLYVKPDPGGNVPGAGAGAAAAAGAAAGMVLAVDVKPVLPAPVDGRDKECHICKARGATTLHFSPRPEPSLSSLQPANP